MIRILFVCHGNICRSPMCEFIFRDKVQKLGLGEQFHIESAATSTEEIGNMPHHGTQQILSRLGISCYGKRARQIRKKDYDEYDYLMPGRKEVLRIRGIPGILNGLTAMWTRRAMPFFPI